MKTKLLVATLLVWLVLGLGLFNFKQRQADAGDGMRPPNWHYAFPSYPNSSMFTLADEAYVNGQNMKMAYLRTDDSVSKIIDFYAGVWQSQGLMPIIDDERPEPLIVVDDFSNKQRLLLAVVDKGSYRVVMPSIIPLDEGENVEPGISLPAPPKSTRINYSAITNFGNLTSTTVLRVPMAPVKINIYYRQQMPLLGFNFDGEKTFQNIDLLQFSAGSVSAQVAIAPVQNTPPVSMVTIMYMESL